MKAPLQISSFRLPNGLRVVLAPNPTSSVVSIVTAYRVGSKDEQHNRTGFAHLFEHLMFEGSKNIPPGMYDTYCSEAGGTNNAYTTHDKTTYYIVLPPHQLEFGLWLESDRLLESAVDEAKLVAQQKVVIEEIKENVENQPYGKFSDIQGMLAFGTDCGYHHDIYGDIKHIQSFSVADAQHFFNTFYRPDNACLVLCGNFEVENAEALVRKYYTDIPASQNVIPRNPFTASMKKGNQHYAMKDAIPLEGLFLSYHCDAHMNSQDAYAAEILASILSDGMSSRMQRALIYEQQISNETGAYLDEREDASLMTLYCAANNPEIHCNQLFASLHDILQNIAQHGVSSQELTKAQNRLATRFVSNTATAGNLGDEIAHHTLFFDNPEGVFSVIDKLNAVTTGQIQDFARRTFHEDNSVRVDFLPLDS
jgi:predicted Zn-dependent peptidase